MWIKRGQRILDQNEVNDAFARNKREAIKDSTETISKLKEKPQFPWENEIVVSHICPDSVVPKECISAVFLTIL